MMGGIRGAGTRKRDVTSSLSVNGLKGSLSAGLSVLGCLAQFDLFRLSGIVESRCIAAHINVFLHRVSADAQLVFSRLLARHSDVTQD